MFEAEVLHKPFTDWIFALFLIVFAIIAILKTAMPYRFSLFARLPFDNKYLLLYEKKDRNLHYFSFFLIILQLISLSLLLYLAVKFFQIDFKSVSGFYFLDFLLFFILFFGIKIGIQQFVSWLFDLRFFSKSVLFMRISYSCYACVLMMLVLFLVLYALGLNAFVIYFLIALVVIINLLAWIIIIKTHQNLIKWHIFYFILYLCTLEIAPLFLIAYATKFL